MPRSYPLVFTIGVTLATLASIMSAQTPSRNAPSNMSSPAHMAPTGSVDERFQSFNVEMVEVTGGRFWKPYGSGTASKTRASNPSSGSSPAGMDPNLFEYRPPINLANPRLRKLAAALGPAYVRVSGTWANTTWFHDSDSPAPAKPPQGFNAILTRPEWKGVIDFANAVNARIVSSFATSPGTRDASGVWTPEQARKFLAYTNSVGGVIAAAEFMNEPTIAAMGGAPKGYDAAAYGRDTAVFRRFIKEAAPQMLFLGPGSVAEGGVLQGSGPSDILSSESLLQATGPVFDAFYHLYAAVSKRCAAFGPASQTTAEAALSNEWLARPDKINAFYAALRDRYVPGKPLWITETADTACGGNPWAATFLDSFRYLDEHGRLAQQGVKVIAHNTLASSAYGLLDENTLNPRPNYWAALLWQKLMGTTVLNPGPSPSPNLHLYAHCLRNHPGGVALLAINTDPGEEHDFGLLVPAQRYTLTAKQLQSTAVQLNGETLQIDADGNLPVMRGSESPAGQLRLAPASITFLAISGAGNSSCN